MIVFLSKDFLIDEICEKSMRYVKFFDFGEIHILIHFLSKIRFFVSKSSFVYFADFVISGKEVKRLNWHYIRGIIWYWYFWGF